jgi:hypothetical protein
MFGIKHKTYTSRVLPVVPRVDIEKVHVSMATMTARAVKHTAMRLASEADDLVTFPLDELAEGILGETGEVLGMMAGPAGAEEVLGATAGPVEAGRGLADERTAGAVVTGDIVGPVGTTGAGVQLQSCFTRSGRKGQKFSGTVPL